MFLIINSSLLKSYIEYNDSLMNAFVDIFYEIIEKSKEFVSSLQGVNQDEKIEKFKESKY